MQKDTETTEEYVRRLVLPLFEKVAKETPINHMMGGSTVEEQKRYTGYIPHNYRLYYDFSKKTFLPTIPQPCPLPMVPTTYQYRSLNFGSEHSYVNFMGCNIRVKKNQIEIINKVDPKKEYLIELGNTKEIHSQIKRIVDTKEKQCKEALELFIKVHGGSSEFQVLKRHSENKIIGESAIENIPTRMKFHSPVVKKVYNKDNVEFSDPAFTVKYLENRAIEDIAPKISEAIKILANSIESSDPLRLLKNSISAINDIFKDKNKKLILSLTAKEKLDFENWLFASGF